MVELPIPESVWLSYIQRKAFIQKHLEQFSGIGCKKDY
jgi:hypothetical protein